jgi:hypothetical protein
VDHYAPSFALLPSMQSEAMTLALIERTAIAIDDLDALDGI